MEKQLYELRIDEEFRDALPPLSELEYSLLEAGIVNEGCTMPIIICHDTIIDGHARYEICHKHGIPFAIEEKEFESKEDAKLWIVARQIGCRNLSDYAKCEAVRPLKEILKAEGKRRMAENNRPNHGEGVAINEEEYLPLQNLAKAGKGWDSRSILAKMAGVSPFNFSKAEKIMDEADEDTKRQVREGEISIHKAFTGLSAKEEPSPQGPKIKHIQGPYAAQKESQDSLTEEADNTETPPSFKASKPVRPEDMIDMSPFPGYEDVSPYELAESHEEIESLGGVPNDDPRMRGIGKFHMIKGQVNRLFDGIMDAILCLDDNSATEENLETLEELINTKYEEILKEIEKRRRES